MRRPGSEWSREARGMVAVAATYVYFLLFAQYGFLGLLAARAPSSALRPVMAAMGIAGLLASIGSAVLLRRGLARALVVFAFCGGTAAALCSLQARALSSFVVIAAAVGLTVGTLTVSLSSELARWLRAPARGVKVAIGTGAAYLVVNPPPLFSGSPERQALAAALAAAVGAVAVATGSRAVAVAGGRSADDASSSTSTSASTPPPALASRLPLLLPDDYRAAGLVAVVLAFVALVGLDSAAFAIIQDSAALKSPTWGDGAQSLRMGVLHLAGALAGGFLLDRRRFFPLLVGVYATFAVGLVLLERGGGLVSGALYAAGIGAYSVALVWYPSSGPEAEGLVPRRWRAAAVYGVSGWLGSAVGVAIAQRHDRVPPALVVVAGALVAAAALLRHRRFAAPLAQSASVVLLCGAVAIWVHGVASASPGLAPSGLAPSGHDAADEARSLAVVDGGAVADAGAVARGRDVYVGEGCLHCHSQYVRHAGADRELWGPWRADADRGSPPLHGVRRQGPDLANVSNRRSETWQRLHLIDPRSVSPGSRMPSYAHLFAGDESRGADGDESRGADLVAYLCSLGAGTGPDRFADIQARPIHVDPAAFGERGHALFATYCARCHGASGRGDGPLASAFPGRTTTLDLGSGPLALVSHGPGIGTPDEGLARLVRFGVPGTSMPGHEHLTSSEVSAIVSHVRAIAP